MRKVSYPSDLTGFQWSLIKPHLPVYPGGRPRKTDLRDVVDAIFHILRTGCQWRYLPKDFPPKSTVWRYFNQWRHNGTLETIHDLLRRKVRAAEKPYSPRTTASVDSQSVDTTSGGEQRGRDNAKNVDGRKRHIVVDSMGLLMAVLVTAASIDDAKAAAELFARLDGQPMSHVKRMYADSKYHNFILYEWVETNAAWELNIVQRPKDAVGWVLLPIRWTVERTFAWLGRCRRLSKDREKSVRSSEAFVKLAMIHLMLNRLAQKKRMPSSTIVRRHKPTCGTDTKHVWTMTLDVRKYLPTLICWQLNYAPWVLKSFRRESQGAVMDAISSATLKRLALPCPPINEQERIATRYSTIVDRLRTEELVLIKAGLLRTGLMQDLLTGKVRVKVDESADAGAFGNQLRSTDRRDQIVAGGK